MSGVFLEPFHVWREGPDIRMRDRVLAAAVKVKTLRDAGLTGQILIAEWLTRGIVPLMSRQLRMWEMSPDLAPFAGTTVAPALQEVDELEGMVAFLTGANFMLPEVGTVPAPLPDDETRVLVSSSAFL